MDDEVEFASTQARRFAMQHMRARATRTDLRQFVNAAGPDTTTCLLCGRLVTTGAPSCSNLNAATLAASAGRRGGKLVEDVALEIRMLCLSYFTASFANALEDQWLEVRYDEQVPNLLQLHWEGGLSLENGIAVAERIAPSFLIYGLRQPTDSDAVRAARHFDSLLPGDSFPLGPESFCGSETTIFGQINRLMQRSVHYSDVLGRPWSSFELGECGTLGECFIRLCKGEPVVLQAITAADVVRGLGDDRNADVRAFALGLIPKVDFALLEPGTVEQVP